jgi:hypothetical protein
MRDLCEFARIEWESRDVEPWADILAALDTPHEHRIWLATLYNTYDALDSAWNVADRWPSPYEWAQADDRMMAATYPIMQERRNLHGGRVNRRMQSYVDHLAGLTEEAWLRQGARLFSPAQWSPPHRFRSLQNQMREVWGVGRQAAFEWAEFALKVAGLPIEPGDAVLWESSGPRQSLEAIYGPAKDEAMLEGFAADARDVIHETTGIMLPWADFETIICDFKVMNRGRYYPGRHLAALKSEIRALGSPPALVDAWNRVVPEPWAAIAPGIDKTKLDVYARTGEMVTSP